MTIKTTTREVIKIRMSDNEILFADHSVFVVYWSDSNYVERYNLDEMMELFGYTARQLKDIMNFFKK